MKNSARPGSIEGCLGGVGHGSRLSTGTLPHSFEGAELFRRHERERVDGGVQPACRSRVPARPAPRLCLHVDTTRPSDFSAFVATATVVASDSAHESDPDSAMRKALKCSNHAPAVAHRFGAP